jgi:hypothetical protein
MDTLGMNNLGAEGPSALNDLRNIRLSFKDGRFQVRLPDGTDLYYTRASLFNSLLEKEVRPNGKTLKFFYEGQELSRVESWDRGEERNYASIDIAGTSLEKAFTTHAGQQALYRYEKRQREGKFKEKKGRVHFRLNSPPLLSSIQKPSHFEEIGYSEQLLLDSFEGKSGFAIDYEGGRAKRLFIEGELLYTFSYQPPIAGKRGGRTTVLSWDKTKKIYSFSKELLLESIASFDEAGALKAEKLFSWNRGLLQSISWLEGGRLLCEKSWKYDSFGNPVEEEISDGQLSFLIKREFSENHLLLKEERQGEAAACFSYVPETNLIACRWREHEGKILRREFFTYDESFNLIEKIEDDGASLDRDDLAHVRERRITRYRLRTCSKSLE